MIFNLMKPVPTTESATMYLYGHEADKTVSYNGVELPELPVWDKTAYPYACIVGRYTTHSEGDVEGIYGILFLSSEPLSYEQTGSIVKFCTLYATKDLAYSTYYYDISVDEHYYNPMWYPSVDRVETYEGYDVHKSNSNEVLWANYDMYNNADNSLVISPSEPVTTYTNADVTIEGVGYVGAILPKLPEWDKTAYPYAVIQSTKNSNNYYLYVTGSYKQFNDFTSIGSWYTFVWNTPLLWAKFTIGEDGWGKWKNFSETHPNNSGVEISNTGGAFIWTNTDLYYDEVLAYEASTPVPVYE